MRNCDCEECGKDENRGNQMEERACTGRSTGANQEGTGNSSDAPRNIEQGEEAGTGGWHGGAHDDVAGGQSGAQAKPNA